MRKLLFPLLVILIFTSCQKQIPIEKTSEEFASVAAKKSSSKINVCHFDGVNSHFIINIPVNAWPDHQSHGDVRLDDQDEDGYVPNNACGFGAQGDCNDNNATINSSATEICFNGIDENCNGQIDENCFVIGANYQGGKIAYILQPGDPGYIAGETHGLIAAAADQSAGAQWGCYGTALSGADGTALGTGNQNTIDIMAGCASSGIAARICGDLELNGYTDWFLPSKDELNKLYENKAVIGGFSDAFYWSSSEHGNSAYFAWSQYFPNGYQNSDWKTYEYPNSVRAVRAF